MGEIHDVLEGFRVCRISNITTAKLGNQATMWTFDVTNVVGDEDRWILV